MRRLFVLVACAALSIAGLRAQEADDRGVGVRRTTSGAAEGSTPAWAAEARQRLINQRSKMKVQLRTRSGKRAFRAGDVVRYEVTTDTAGYLYLIVFSEQKVATCVFPNAIDPQNRVSAGTLHLPRNNSYTFPIGEPFGKDLTVAIVATTPLPFDGNRVEYSWDEVFDRLRAPAITAEVEREFGTRGVGVAATNDWQAATIVIETRLR